VRSHAAYLGDRQLLQVYPEGWPAGGGVVDGCATPGPARRRAWRPAGATGLHSRPVPDWVRSNAPSDSHEPGPARRTWRGGPWRATVQEIVRGWNSGRSLTPHLPMASPSTPHTVMTCRGSCPDDRCGCPRCTDATESGIDSLVTATPARAPDGLAFSFSSGNEGTFSLCNIFGTSICPRARRGGSTDGG